MFGLTAAPLGGYFRLTFAMLSDQEAEEIERGRRAKVVGPVVLKWVDLLLADRRERVAQLLHLRKRLAQAFRYLDGLSRDHSQAAAAPPPRQRPACPLCHEPYEQASGDSPQGIVYVHADGRECHA